MSIEPHFSETGHAAAAPPFLVAEDAVGRLDLLRVAAIHRHVEDLRVNDATNALAAGIADGAALPGSNHTGAVHAKSSLPSVELTNAEEDVLAPAAIPHTTAC